MKFSKYIWIIGGGQLQIPLVEEAKNLVIPRLLQM
jgi:hypothetical protein